MKNILVIGDVCLDHFLYGSVYGTAPEAPVPVLKVEREEWRLGMGANVAKNLKEIGANVKLLAGGNLGDNTIIRPLLFKNHLPFGYTGKNRTTIKQRTVCNGIYLSRNDYEDTKPIDMFPLLKNNDLTIYDAIILSDYGKGTIGYPQELINYIKSKTNAPIFVDPDKNKQAHHYEGVFCVKANEKEAHAISASAFLKCDPLEEIEKICQVAIMTQGDKGCQVRTKSKTTKIKGIKVKSIDPTGCGDSFLAKLVVEYCNHSDIIKAAKEANKAAAKAVTKFGT